MAVELEFGVALALEMARRHKNGSGGRAKSHLRFFVFKDITAS